MNKTIFNEINESFDSRGVNGKRFQFKYFLVYLVMAELAGANSVRKKEVYLNENRRELGVLFDLHWHKSPSRAAINAFINSLNENALKILLNCFVGKKENSVHMDGKTLRGSGANLLNLFTEKTKQCVDQFSFEKGKEIECAYNAFVLGNFDKNTWVSLDALHAQKKLLLEQKS